MKIIKNTQCRQLENISNRNYFSDFKTELYGILRKEQEFMFITTVRAMFGLFRYFTD